MKKTLINPSLDQVKEAFNNSGALFICPNLNSRELLYYESIFNEYAPEETISFLSSGSTGNPKLIVHSKKNLLIRAKAQAKELGLYKESKYLSPLPLTHLSGFMPLLRAQASGAKLRVKEKSEGLIELLQEFRPSHISLVPSQLDELVKNKIDLEFLESLLLGGSGCSEELLNKARELKYPIRACYGMSETASFFSIAKSEEFLNSGDINLVMMDGFSAFTQKSGRLTIESDQVFLGSITGNGFTKSGGILPTFDLGEVDAPSIKIFGRSDLVFKSGGEKVDPLEVENKLSILLGTSHVVVVPKKDEKWGHITTAFIYPLFENIEYAELVKELPPHQRPKFFYPLVLDEGIKPNRSKLLKIANPPRTAFIHGFMGEKYDLCKLAKNINVDAVFWDLPGHNGQEQEQSFESAIAAYTRKIIEEKIEIIYGYSMGGRLALAVAENLATLKKPLKALILESVHPGILDKEEKDKRIFSDKNLFSKMPKDASSFLKSWYENSIFGDYQDTDEGKHRICAIIDKWDPQNFEKALEVLSTGHQKDYRPFLKDSPHPILYLSGEKDQKYFEFTKEFLMEGPNQLRVKGLKDGYHNLHFSPTIELISEINAFISSCN